MQRDSHASLEWIFFSKKKKKKKKMNAGFITLVLSSDGLFPTVGLLCPSLVLRSGSYCGGRFLVFPPWAEVFEVDSDLYPKKILWHLEYPFILWEIRCTHASILDSCEKSQVYIRIIKIHCDHSENTLL